MPLPFYSAKALVLSLLESSRSRCSKTNHFVDACTILLRSPRKYPIRNDAHESYSTIYSSIQHLYVSNAAISIPATLAYFYLLSRIYLNKYFSYLGCDSHWFSPTTQTLFNYAGGAAGIGLAAAIFFLLLRHASFKERSLWIPLLLITLIICLIPAVQIATVETHHGKTFFYSLFIRSLPLVCYIFPLLGAYADDGRELRHLSRLKDLEEKGINLTSPEAAELVELKKTWDLPHGFGIVKYFMLAFSYFFVTVNFAYNMAKFDAISRLDKYGLYRTELFAGRDLDPPPENGELVGILYSDDDSAVIVLRSHGANVLIYQNVGHDVSRVIRAAPLQPRP